MLLEKESLHKIYLGLGSNLGDRGENLFCAISNIEERIGNVISTSAFYVTEPVGFDSENQFLNAVCEVQTKLQPLEVLDITQGIEKMMGRIVKSENHVYADRVIDIDLLLFDDKVVEMPQLTLPHPQLHKRQFVLLPLAEIAGEYVHPVLRKTIDELKKEL